MKATVKTFVCCATVVALGASALVAGLSASAGEVPPKVKITKIKTITAPYKGKALLKPTYTITGNVEVKKATLTIKKDGKTVKKNVKKVKLAAGKYTVTQKVTYRTFTVAGEAKTFSKKKTKTRNQRLTIKAGVKGVAPDPHASNLSPSSAPTYVIPSAPSTRNPTKPPVPVCRQVCYQYASTGVCIQYVTMCD